MKRSILALIMLALFTIPALADEIKVDLPAVKSGFFYDFADKNLTAGVTSELISYKDRATIEVGAVQGSCLVGISYKLLDLERLGLEYKWAKILDISTGIFAGYNFENREVRGGLYASLIKVTF